jgi:hypothetical protein
MRLPNGMVGVSLDKAAVYELCKAMREAFAEHVTANEERYRNVSLPLHGMQALANFAAIMAAAKEGRAQYEIGDVADARNIMNACLDALARDLGELPPIELEPENPS